MSSNLHSVQCGIFFLPSGPSDVDRHSPCSHISPRAAFTRIAPERRICSFLLLLLPSTLPLLVFFPLASPTCICLWLSHGAALSPLALHPQTGCGCCAERWESQSARSPAGDGDALCVHAVADSWHDELWASPLTAALQLHWACRDDSHGDSLRHGIRPAASLHALPLPILSLSLLSRTHHPRCCTLPL